MFRFSGLISLILTAMPLAVSAGPARIGGDLSRDLRQTIQARRLLADDPDLAPWNIGVIVQDRVATLWGPVPSAEVAFRAEICLKSMIELTEIRNELFMSELIKPMRVPLKINNPPMLIPQKTPAVPRIPRLLEPVPESHLPSIRRLPATIRFPIEPQMDTDEHK